RPSPRCNPPWTICARPAATCTACCQVLCGITVGRAMARWRQQGSCSYLKYRTIINNKDAPAILCFWPAWRRTVHRGQGFTPVLTIIKVLLGGAAPHPRKGCLVGSMVPSCFAPSRRFGAPYSQPPRFPKEL